MKALTLHQPWASLISLGAKSIETRSWSTNYRGPLAIHAGARRPPSVWQSPHENLPPAIDWIGMPWEWTEGDDYHGLYRWAGPLGAVVATCTLVDVVPVGRSYGTPEPVDDALAQSRFAWILEDVKPTTKRCPACWGNPPPPTLMPGICVDIDGQWWHDPFDSKCGRCTPGCSTCMDRGTCGPIPAKGHQRLFDWKP